MNWRHDCAAVIPCLNEERFIGAVVAGARRFVDRVFVVDDGSTDHTAARAVEAGAGIVQHATPQGKGVALQDGWRRAREAGFDWSLSLDGDGQHAAEDIPKLFACADATSARLISGDRMSDPAGMPWLRRRTNRWMSRRLAKLAGQPLPDTQCGFRLMHLPTWAALPPMAAHFEIESELMLAFAAAGERVEFVPIAVIYGTERSKINPLGDTLRWVRWYWHWRRRMRELHARVPAV